MSDLVFTRRNRQKRTREGQYCIKVDAAAYDMIAEVTDETGLSVKCVASEMLKHAYKEITYRD